MPTSRFLAKIPNTKVLRDFLVNSGGYYVPPLKDLTNDFCRVKTYILTHWSLYLEITCRWEKAS